MCQASSIMWKKVMIQNFFKKLLRFCYREKFALYIMVLTWGKIAGGELYIYLFLYINREEAKIVLGDLSNINIIIVNIT